MIRRTHLILKGVNDEISWHLLLLLFFIGSCSAPEPASSWVAEAPASDASLTTLFLVRHAEKAEDGTDDPPLTEKGEQRVSLLTQMLREAAIDAVYSTPFQRNVNTVKPLADTLGLTVTHYDQQQDLVDFVDILLKEYQGEKVLVCGHSSTVPGMLNVLIGQKKYAELAQGEHDDLFVVTITGKGEAVVTNVKMPMMQQEDSSLTN